MAGRFFAAIFRRIDKNAIKSYRFWQDAAWMRRAKGETWKEEPDAREC